MPGRTAYGKQLAKISSSWPELCTQVVDRADTRFPIAVDSFFTCRQIEQQVKSPARGGEST